MKILFMSMCVFSLSICLAAGDWPTDIDNSNIVATIDHIDFNEVEIDVALRQCIDKALVGDKNNSVALVFENKIPFRKKMTGNFRNVSLVGAMQIVAEIGGKVLRVEDRVIHVVEAGGGTESVVISRLGNVAKILGFSSSQKIEKELVVSRLKAKKVKVDVDDLAITPNDLIISLPADESNYLRAVLQLADREAIDWTK